MQILKVIQHLVTADELKLIKGNRNQYQQTIKCGNVKGSLVFDDGGHIIGIQFEGIGEQINLIPMKSSINRSGGTYYQMESEFANTINNGGTVKNVEWEIIYSGNNRPVRIEVSAKVNGINKNYRHLY